MVGTAVVTTVGGTVALRAVVVCCVIAVMAMSAMLPAVRKFGTRHQGHAAFGAFTRLRLRDLWVHGTGVVCRSVAMRGRAAVIVMSVVRTMFFAGAMPIMVIPSPLRTLPAMRPVTFMPYVIAMSRIMLPR